MNLLLRASRALIALVISIHTKLLQFVVWIERVRTNLAAKQIDKAIARTDAANSYANLMLTREYAVTDKYKAAATKFDAIRTGAKAEAETFGRNLLV